MSRLLTGNLAVAGALLVAPHSAFAAVTLMPPMGGPLSSNPNPILFEAGPIGNIDVFGAVTGLALWQDSPMPGDDRTRFDLSNGEVFAQKTDGWLQFFLQGGVYSLPSLGTKYANANGLSQETYGPIPQALLKVVVDENFSMEVGKLPAMVGNEYAFTFQNMNIERGLLWNQTPSISRGVQMNYANGPLSVSLSWNDGYYSNRFNWATALVSYALPNEKGVFTFVGGANLGHTGYSSPATPFAQNNSDIFDLIYTNTSGRWTISPYVQVSEISSARGSERGASSIGAALLASYKIDSAWNIAVRGEYIGTGGALNLLYGAGSNAWSVTVTPTYQRGIYFARAEASYVMLENAQPGSSLGRNFDKNSQARLMAETGVLF